MFNFSRFNIQKFNIVNVTESDFAYSDTFAEAFGSDSILSIGLTLTETHEEDFDSFTDVIVGFRYAETFVETFDMSLAMLINSYVIETHAEDIIAGIVVAGDSPLVETHTDNLVAGVKLGIDIPSGEIIHVEIIDSFISSDNFDNEYAVIDVTIPAGGVLILDSDFFTALLNSVNVLDTYSGDWAYLDRDVVNISISSGTGTTLDNQILYTEKYL